MGGHKNTREYVLYTTVKSYITASVWQS